MELIEDIFSMAAIVFYGWFSLNIGKLDKAHEWHTGYAGFALVLLGLLFNNIVASGVGVILLVDDAWQYHKMLTVPTYLSPIHKLLAKLYAKWPWTIKIGQFMDRLCR